MTIRGLCIIPALLAGPIQMGRYKRVAAMGGVLGQIPQGREFLKGLKMDTHFVSSLIFDSA